MSLTVKNKNKRVNNFLIFALAIGVILIGWFAERPVFAQSVNSSIEQISLSASLFNNENRIIRNGSYEVRFAIYSNDRESVDPYPSNSDAGSRLWEETQTVEVKNGIFRVFLGTVNRLPENLAFESGDYYIGMRIGDDSEMVPRKKLGSVPRAVNAEFLEGRKIGNQEGDIPILGNGDKIDIKNLPTGTGSKQLVLGNDARLGESHVQNTDTGTDSQTFKIGNSIALADTNFDLTVSSAGTAPTLRFNGTLGTWEFSNDGMTFTEISGGVDPNSLDFTELKDALTLDASTDISVTGSNVFSITNTGTGYSFLVNDEASDATPFVIAANGNVGVGTANPITQFHLLDNESSWPFLLESNKSVASAFQGSAANYFGMNAGYASFGPLWDFILPNGRALRLASADVFGTGDAFFQIGTTNLTPGAYGVLESANLGGLAVGTSGSYPMFLYTNRTERLRVTETGNVGIGDTSPDSKLSIDASGANTMPLSIKTNGSEGNYTTTNSGIFMYDAAGTETLRIVATDPNTNNYNSGNLFIGAQAGANNPTDNSTAGYYNSAVGAQSLYSNTIGILNSALGMQSLYSNTTGGDNSALGMQSLYSNTTGNDNSAFGMQSLFSNTTGDDNSAVGAEALFYNTTGTRNTTLGKEAGYNPSNNISQYRIIADTDMTLIGYGATKDNAATLTNGIAIGSGAHVLQNNQAVLGNDNITTTLLKGSVGIGTNTPLTRLQVGATPVDSGSLTITGPAFFKSLTNNGGSTPASFEPALILGREGIADEAYANFALFNIGRYENSGVDSKTQLDIVLTDAVPAAGGAPVMSLQSGGNVGIGTSSPSAKLHVIGGDDHLTFANASIALGHSTTGQYPHFIHTRHRAGVASGNAIDFYTNDGTAAGVFPANAVLGLSIDNGQVGIGNSNPSAKLDILDTALAGSGSLAGSVLNIAQTWDTSGTPTAMKLNVTDTSSNTNSLLMDLQIGGISKFKVRKNGDVTSTSGFAAPYFYESFASTNDFAVFNRSMQFNSYQLNSSSAGWRFTNSVAADLTSGQLTAFSIAPQYNQTSGTAANTDFLINRTQTAVGSGAQLLIDAQVNGVSKFKVDNTGNIMNTGYLNGVTNITMSGNLSMTGANTIGVDNGVSLNINGGGGTVSGDGVVFNSGKTYTATSGNNVPVAIRNTYNQTSGTAANTDFLINRTQTAVGSGAQLLMDAQVGGVSMFNIDNTGVIRNSSAIVANGFITSPNGFIFMSSNQNDGVMADYSLRRYSGPSAGNYGWRTEWATPNTLTSGQITAFAVLPSYNQTSGTAANTDFLINRTQTAVGSGAQLLMDAQVGGVSQFNINASGVTQFSGSGTTHFLTIQTNSIKDYYQNTSDLRGTISMGVGSGTEIAISPNGSGGAVRIDNGGAALLTGGPSSGSTAGSFTIRPAGIGEYGGYAATGRDLLLIGGAASDNGGAIARNGGSVYIDGGAPINAGTAGNILLGTTRGNVGIGASPAATLDITGTSDQAQLVVRGYTGQTNDLQDFYVDGVKKVYFDSTGALVNAENDFSKYDFRELSGAQYIKNNSGARFTTLGIGTAPTGNEGININIAGNTNAVAYGVNATSSNMSGTAGVGGFFTSRSLSGAITYSNSYGLNVGTLTLSGGAAVTNNYGIYLNNGTAGTNDWGIYQNDANNNYFAGNIGIGDTTPDGKLDIEPTGAVTAASYGINLSNLTTNATTDGINKYGAYITSTGSWTGDVGTATNNYGLYVDTVSGGDNNYGAYFAQNVGIGTTTPNTKLTLSGVEDIALLAFADSTNSRQANVYTGITSPESRVSASIGSLFIDTVNGTLYQKTGNDGGNTSWTPFTQGTTTHMAKITRDAAQSIPNITDTKVNFDHIDFDTGGMADVASNRINIMRNGKYLITAGFAMPGLDSSESVYVYLKKNGTAVAEDWNDSGTADNPYIWVEVNEVLDLQAGDYLEVSMWHNEDAAQNTFTTPEQKPTLSAVELAPSGGTGIDLLTDAGADSYLTATGDNFLIGTTTNARTSKVAVVQQNAADILSLFDGSTEVFTVKDGGNIGIGDSTPSYKLEVATDVSSNYVSNFFNDGNNADRYGIQIQAGADDGSGTTYYVNALDGDGGQVGYIARTAGTFALTDVSDIRTKTNISDTRFIASSLLNQLRVVDFNRKSDTDGPRITGFIAQEVQSVYPNAITQGENGFLGIMKDAFIPLLVKGFQENDDRLTAAENTLSLIDLKTSQNITTLSELQDSVDEQLTLIGNNLNVLTEKDTETEVRFIENDSRLSDIDAQIEKLNLDLSGEVANTAILETQVTTLTEQVSTLFDFYAAFDMGSLVAADSDGNVELAGKLKATLLETGGIAIEVVDEEAATIGTATITPVVTDADNDGKDDETGSDGSSVEVMTKAMISMGKESRIFTSFKDNPGAFSWIEKIKNNGGEYVGFRVKLSQPISDTVKLDWWLIEQR